VADVFIIAVPTPLREDKTADMSYVVRAAESVLPHLRPGNLVILESTSPPGTCRDLLAPILARSGLRPGENLHLAHCPERVLPGRILLELIKNDRVIGGLRPGCAERARELYARFVEGEIFLTDATTAEMVKVLENTYRDVNIALANEAALICESLGIDFAEARRFANRHPRVNVHAAGPGVGGHCISVDPWFLVERAPSAARLIRCARERNDGMPEHVAGETRRLLEDIAAPKVAVLGLAYKGDVDDIRESPAIHVVELLQAAGIAVAVHDPHVKAGPFALQSLDGALSGADLLLLLTDHSEFARIDPAAASGWMRTPQVYDTRNVLNAAAWESAGFRVKRLGRH
jgi:UDP-N-acetyl-D-mannosaminuronic acid dehydrogenase